MEECRPILNTGLRGFTVATTRISHVDKAAEKLIYRGYLAKDLADSSSFEEVIFLLLYVVASLRNGTVSYSTQVELQATQEQVRELKHQLKVYDVLKEDYLL